MLQIILDKILLGFSLAATIGPLNIEMIKRRVSSGFWAAFNVRLGGAITNSVCLIVAYFGLGRLIKNYPNIIPIIYYLGSTILIYMGISTIISSCSVTSIIFDMILLSNKSFTLSCLSFSFRIRTRIFINLTVVYLIFLDPYS